MKDISGKTAIVTGAASGIGLGIATALAEAGANVVMADIQKDAVEQGGARPLRHRSNFPSELRGGARGVAARIFAGRPPLDVTGRSGPYGRLAVSECGRSSTLQVSSPESSTERGRLPAAQSVQLTAGCDERKGNW